MFRLLGTGSTRINTEVPKYTSRQGRGEQVRTEAQTVKGKLAALCELQANLYLV